MAPRKHIDSVCFCRRESCSDDDPPLADLWAPLLLVVDSRSGALYCQMCDDLVWDPTFEELRVRKIGTGSFSANSEFLFSLSAGFCYANHPFSSSSLSILLPPLRPLPLPLSSLSLSLPPPSLFLPP